VLIEGGQRYLMTMIDDVLYKALNCFKICKTKVENQLEKKIKRFRSN
jgi:hypothetical protein